MRPPPTPMEYQAYSQRALVEPMGWFRLDSDFTRDMKVRRLTSAGGWAYVGLYVATIGALAQADGHMYDMRDGGWEFLRADLMNGGCELEREDLEAFVGMLVDLGLADRTLWEESGKLSFDRLLREAEENARSVATSRAKVDAMNRAKAEAKR